MICDLQSSISKGDKGLQCVNVKTCRKNHEGYSECVCTELQILSKYIFQYLSSFKPLKSSDFEKITVEGETFYVFTFDFGNGVFYKFTTDFSAITGTNVYLLDPKVVERVIEEENAEMSNYSKNSCFDDDHPYFDNPYGDDYREEDCDEYDCEDQCEICNGYCSMGSCQDEAAINKWYGENFYGKV